MSDAENGNEEMVGQIAVLHDRLLNDEDEHDELDENEFASILRQLIRSGDIMVLNYENFIPNPLPVIKKKPNLDKLKVRMKTFYDVLTGAIVEAIEGHHDIVRDVAWHPHRTEIITCSWDHAVHRHTYCGPADREEDKEEDVRKKSRPRPRNYENDSEDDDEEKDRPIRRSRRLAEKNNSVYRTLRSSMRTSSGRN
ncbi:wd-repeat protein [Anopheles sinensis]|uniref:Wd-repeat protein n=1 Tax=Anopheles sinensis TaxID=74873 RepID=A0A084VDS0_ANOSI|nr:wd-repeat protein [Anopheles sinensis]